MTLSERLDRPIVVQKYGGSSVASTAHLQRVAERVVRTREAGNHVVVVVSAMAATTDDLLTRARELAGSPSRRELDMLLSCGERASMALLAMAIHELGHSAVSLTGSQSGIMTNDRHSGARIIEVRPIRVYDELDRDNIVIVAGFQGVSYKREITTLGRGGSDTTAVALAAALGADYCEICSDVEGVYTGDPRLVESAELLEAIRADEMLELAAHGAKVLHPGCVEIAKRSDIKLFARATAKDGGGTRIDALGDVNRERPVGVTGAKGVVHLQAATSELLLAAVAEAGISVLAFSDRHGDASLCFVTSDVPDWDTLRADFRARSIEVVEGLALVSVVGESLGNHAPSIAKILTWGRSHGSLATFSSPLRVSLLVNEGNLEPLLKGLHHALIESPATA